MPAEFPVPAFLVERARRFYADGSVPVVPRVAATVVLVRPALSHPAATGLEVYLLRRATTMAFASGMYAFPGGSVDPADVTDPSTVDLSARLGLPRGAAGAVVRAALREVEEEAGLVLGAEALTPWARWITPEFEARRYDTYFFVAVMPAGQVATNVSTEADHAMWVRPADAIRLLASGEISMLPPTIVALRELAEYSIVDDVLRAASRRDVATAVMPRIVDGRLML